MPTLRTTEERTNRDRRTAFQAMPGLANRHAYIRRERCLTDRADGVEVTGQRLAFVVQDVTGNHLSPFTDQ